MPKIEPIEFDKHPIWLQQSEEIDDAYDRFHRWYLPQIKPNLLNAYRLYCQAKEDTEGQGKKLVVENAPQSWRRDSERYRWQERHRSYWRWVAQENLEWQQERLRELAEVELNLANRLFLKADQLLNMPINPENDRLKDATNLVRCGSELARKSLGVDGINEAIGKITRAGFQVIDPTILNTNKEELASEN